MDPMFYLNQVDARYCQMISLGQSTIFLILRTSTTYYDCRCPIITHFKKSFVLDLFLIVRLLKYVIVRHKTKKENCTYQFALRTNPLDRMVHILLL